jgi:hypothetical protein
MDAVRNFTEILFTTPVGQGLFCGTLFTGAGIVLAVRALLGEKPNRTQENVNSLLDSFRKREP